MFPPMAIGGGGLLPQGHELPDAQPDLRAPAGRSYRELPLRLFEFGVGLPVREVRRGARPDPGPRDDQDDSHSYCTPEQAPDEIKKLLYFVLGLLRDFGLDDFYLELSTRDDSKDKFIGTEEEWATATAVLEAAAVESGLQLVPDPGGAAFYGPKISVQARDAIGRTWQLSTIQYDFNQPARFDLEYQAADGSRQQPVMIHSAKFGSHRAVPRRAHRALRRRVPALAGAGPGGRRSRWPRSTRATSPASPTGCARAGVRVEVDTSDDRMGKKIRNAEQQKVPYILIAGGEDEAAGAVSFRYRDRSQKNGVPVADAVAEITDAITRRLQV